MSITVFGLDETQPVEYRPGFTYPKSVNLPFEHPAWTKWANGNAHLVLELLGLKGEDVEGELYGQVTVAEARRAVIRARATFARVVPGLVREECQERVAVKREDGTVELRTKVWVGGVDAGYFKRQVDQFEACVSVLAVKGATHIAWG